MSIFLDDLVLPFLDPIITGALVTTADCIY